MIERTYHCDNPSCDSQVPETSVGLFPAGWVAVEQVGHAQGSTRHYCGWECVRQVADQVAPLTVEA